MGGKSKSFEEFFYSKKNSLYNIEVVSDYADKHKGDYTLYKGFMLCPECQKAELTFVHKSSYRRAHLKKIQSANHTEYCSYNFEYAAKKLIKEYVNTLSYNQVQDRLNAIMNMLCNNTQKSGLTSNGSNASCKAKDNPFLVPDITKESRNLKALRRKRLVGWIDESDGTDLYIFYGKVKLSVKEKIGMNKEKKEYLYYLLTLKTQNRSGDWKYRTTIYRGRIKDNVDEDKTYQIVTIGNLNFNYKWWQINLINQNAIKYEEINS